MTTYNSYEEAKIANPDKEIIRFDKQDEFKAVGNDELSAYLTTWSKCNPADHCMTVEKFLADGHKFVVGDLIIERDCASIKRIEPIDLPNFNIECMGDEKRFILRAAALKKPKRTKVDWPKGLQEKGAAAFDRSVSKIAHELRTKVDMIPVSSVGELATYRNDLFFRNDAGAYISTMNHTFATVMINMDEGSLFYQIETEIDERQEFIDAYNELRREFKLQSHTENFSNFMADSGRFKLVDSDKELRKGGFIPTDANYIVGERI